MKSLIKAEFRKIFTIRSTYVMIGLSFVGLIIFGFLANGWKIDLKDLNNTNTLSQDITAAVSTLSIFPGLIALLLFTHEYRHNTILYTLTMTNSRSKVLIAKIITASIFAILFTIVFGILSPVFSDLGVVANHHHLVAQTFPYWSLIWKVILYGWGYTMAALLIGVLVKNQIGAIVTLFILPETVEGLLSLLLKNNTVYLPFSALHTVIGQGMGPDLNTITPFHAALVFLAYLIVGWVIAWILFLHKDAI